LKYVELSSAKRVVVCEGGSAQRFANDGIDGEVYNRIFASSEPDTTFFSSGSHTDTEKARAMLAALSATVLPGMEVRRLIDRDDRSDTEVAAERAKRSLVLTCRNLESYLFNDEIIRLLCQSAGKPEVADQIIAKRTEAISAKGGKVDDFKQAAGETYVACKVVLQLTSPGNDTKAFMRDTLSALVLPATETFKQLHHDIFGPRLGSGPV
jgi:hypothetical protein